MYSQALSEDPTAFDYDGVYDKMKENTKQKDIEIRAEKLNAKQPKYMSTLLTAHKDRKREQEIIYNSNLLKEKDKEGNVFSDKEKFVTAGYKKKLAEDKIWEEEQQKKAERDGDISSRKNFNGFYGNFINSVAATKESAIKSTKQEPPKVESKLKQPPQDTKSTKVESDNTKPTESVQKPKDSSPPRTNPTLKPAGPSEVDKKRKYEELEKQRLQEEEEKQKAAEEKKQQDEEEAKKKLARRNDATTVADAKARYLQRKASLKVDQQPVQ